mgnify:CR=1 FL=1
MTDRNDGRPRHSASHIHCAVPFFCARSGTEGEAGRRCGGGCVAVRGGTKAFGGVWVVGSAGNASRSLRACVGSAWGSGSAREGRVAVRGRAKVFGGEWVVRSAGLTHIRHSSTRARVLLYIRPPCPRREIAAMGPKDAPCEHPSPAKAFAPAPSAFALPRPRSHFPRPRSHFPRIAFRGPRGAIGLPQQHLSTMGYPRKSYPHRCSPPCAKRSRPRACARVYIIYRSPVGRSRGVFAPLRKRVRAVVPPCPAPPCAGWGRAKAKADAPSHSNPPLSAYRRAPRRLNGHPASAGGRENDRMAHRRTATPTHRTPRGNDTCTIRVPRHKGAQSVVHNL